MKTGTAWAGALACALAIAAPAPAGEVRILDVLVTRTGPQWEFRVKLEHEDSGWPHYADAWRVRSLDGRVLGTRILRHPHVEEQPFTRSLRLRLPRHLRRVVVEAHDNVHGWSRQRVVVDLARRAGPRYRVRTAGLR